MINYNVEPYYDDFNPNKNFHRILFKPGAAVQSRELTQVQTILQNQISSFASAIYSQNTPVSGGKVTTNLNCYYLKLNSTYNGVSVDVSLYKNLTITDSTGTVVATVIASAAATSSDPATLVINYNSGERFVDGSTLYTFQGTVPTPFATLVSADATGQSSTASISKGIFYVVNGYNQATNSSGVVEKYSIGNFVQVEEQTIILEKYSNTPSMRVGLQITEQTVDYTDDDSLLDPALGASNYQAPGADRYQITLTLATKPLSLGDDDLFIELVKYNEGSVEKQVDSTVYSVIDDYFAKRTLETNGDFIVNDFNITPVANTSNSDQYDLKIGKGIAYVRGYRVENQSDLSLVNDRARDTTNAYSQFAYIDYGSYYLVDYANGVFGITSGQTVDLHLKDKANVVTTNATTYGATYIGTAKINGFDYYSSVSDTNANTYIYKAHLYDVQTKTLSSNTTASTTNTVTFYDTTGKFSSANDAYVGVTLTTDAGYVGLVTAYAGATKVATVSPNFTVNPGTANTVTLRFSTQDAELIANTNGTTTISTWASISNYGKVGGVASGYADFKNPNYPELIVKLGPSYINNTSNGSYSVNKVFREKQFSGAGSLTFTTDITGGTFVGSGSLSADAIKQNFTVIDRDTGYILPFNASANTISVSGSSVTLTASAYASKYVHIIAQVNLSNVENNDIIKKKTLVQGSTLTAATFGAAVADNVYVSTAGAQVYIEKAALVGTNAQQSLYVPDVKRIVKIIDTLSPSTNAASGITSGQDITARYSFNNGQKDSYYDHAYISLKPGYPAPRGNMLVIFDYYSHDTTNRQGYFSVKSYTHATSNETYAQIGSYTSKNGTKYNLRDCLDFRPVRVANSTTFSFEADGLIPTDLSDWVGHYSYYLGRRDKLILSKDKNFEIIQGTPDVNPSYPVQPDGSLLIANLVHNPYTAYLPSEAPKGTLPDMSLEKVLHKRWTMGDISDLQTRVNNIEYYTALNLLEQKAQSLQVPDVNGLNRFKNGILVDDFSSLSVADTSNDDFAASVDKLSKQMTASQDVTNYPLQCSFGVNSLNRPVANATYMVKTAGATNIFTLPYTTANVVTQRLASNTVNINPFGVSISEGVMYMNPPMDNWVDNQAQPDLLFVDPNMQVYQASNTLNTLNVTNWQTIPGTQYTTTSTQTNGSATTTQTSTFANQSQTVTTGYWTNLGSSYSYNNSFITDVSIQPYIRPQEILFRAKGMKLNTPVSVYFDGVNVEQYIVNPDIIELTDVTGEFKEDDVIGYVDTSSVDGTPLAFTPIGVVYSAVTSSSNTRLYIAGNYHTGINTDTDILQAATFDTNGNFVANTAYGRVTSNNFISHNYSGTIYSVGGNVTTAYANTSGLFHPQITGHTSFMNNHGVWGSPVLTGSFDMTFDFDVSSNGTYYMQHAGSLGINVRVDGGTWSNSSVTCQSTYVPLTLTAGNHSIRIVNTTDTNHPHHAVAVAISTAAWQNATTKGSLVTSGNIIFSTRTPKISTQTSVVSSRNITGGGKYYTGVNKVGLKPYASSDNNFYTNTKIYITTTDIDSVSLKQTTTTYSSTILSYDGTTKMATLSSNVNVSVGYNTIVGGDITSKYSLSGVHSNNYTISTQAGGKAAKLSTNEKGAIAGIFNVPANTFRTGDRILRIDNRTTEGDPASADTYAEATFTASGLSTKSQALNFSASISSAKNTVTRTQTRSTLISSTTTITNRNNRDPLAQTFIIDGNNYPNGVFLDSVKLFFYSKPTNSDIPVTLSIVGTLNGYPNGETLDHSFVTLEASKVNTSNTPHYLDSTTYTEFVFPAPVYIQPDVLYAFIVKSDSLDYNVYLAAQNATAAASSVKQSPSDATPQTITKIGGAPYVGSLFESQNSMTWVADPAKSLMFTIDRCVFDTTAAPRIPFVVPTGLPTRKATSSDIQRFYDPAGVTNLNGTTTSQNVACHAFNISTTDYVPAKGNIVYEYVSELADGSGVDQRIVSPGKYGSPTYDNIYLNDGKGERLLEANSSNSFTLYATFSTTDDTISPVLADDGLSLYNIRWRINDLGLTNSSISIANTGSNYPNNEVIALTISTPSLAGGTQATGYAQVANNRVESIWIANPGSGYLTAPTITAGANTTANATIAVTTEFSPKGGNALAKYITRKSTLATGSDSGDLRVFYTAYRPAGTNIYVFYKIQAREDGQAFDDGSWQLMTTINNTNAYSTSRTDLIEFEAAPGINGAANNQVSYTSTTGTTYTSFYQFAVKVVLTTSDNTAVPYLGDLRVLALPSGTGL